MPGLYTLIATRTDGETLTAAKYNSDHQNHIDNQELQKTDDFSATVVQMQTNIDPGEVGTESLATDASGELSRLRFAIKEIKEAVKNASIAQWYTSISAADAVPLDQNQGTRNLLANGDFEDWRDGTSVAPFLFTLVGAGATVARDGTNFKTGTFAASVTRVGTDTQLEQDAIARAGGQAYIRSRTYTFGAWVRATVASRVRLRLNDGVGSAFSSYHTGGGAFEYLSVSRTLDALATALKPGLQIDTGDTNSQIDSAMLVEGDLKVAFALRGEISVFRRVFTASGTYTKPSNLIAIRVLALGGGGAGGGHTTTTKEAGGGGGSGNLSESLLVASAIGATETVTVGAGGTGVSGGNGNSGADTSFGALVEGKGGGGGSVGSANAAVNGGAGGLPGTGNLTTIGVRGGFGDARQTTPTGGRGAASALGAGTQENFSLNTGGVAADPDTGSGGSGAMHTDTGVNRAGGAGGSGIVIVWETVVI